MTFHKNKESISNTYYYEPVSNIDICSHLLKSGKVGRDERPMIPLVKQAEEKGADYLIYKFPFWKNMESLKKILQSCFEDITFYNNLTYYTKDKRMGSISGVILFSKYDKFIVINNELSNNANWICI